MIPIRLLATLCLLPFPVLAINGGPDAFGYRAYDETTDPDVVHEWIEPTFSADVILQNNTAAAGTIDLTVPWGGFYGTPVRQLRVSRNGFLTTDLADPGTDETNDDPLPASPSAGGGNRLYVLHDNIELDTSTGRVTYEYLPRSPHPLHGCGVHVITWRNVHHSTGDTTRFDFQALLFDNFDILLQYRGDNPEKGGGSTTGLQNAAATIGLTISANDAEIGGGSAILITPPRYVVNTVEDELDTPAGAQRSLREMIRDAVDGARIEFDSGLPVSSAPLIDLSTAGGGQNTRIDLDGRNLAVDGSDPGARPTIYGAESVRHFNLFNGTHLALCDLRLTHGMSTSLTNPSGSVRVQTGASLVADGCDFLQNATENEGGVIFADDANSFVALSHCQLMGNRARLAGGVLAARDGAAVRLDHCLLWENESSSSAGGALSLRVAEVELRHCDFTGNGAALNGGAIVANVGVDAGLFACSFDSNHALNGGAIAVENSATASAAPAAFVFSRCTFSENLALVHGGALYEESKNLSSQTASLAFRHSTIFRNASGSTGGGVTVNDGIPDFQGACLAGNTVSGEPGNFHALGSGSAQSFGDNLESGTDAGWTGGLDQQGVDPKLTAIGWYGGFVRTCLPLQGSPLIDRAILGSAASPTDARGIPTAQDGDSSNNGTPFDDIGAVELAPQVTVTSSNVADLQAAIDSVAQGGVIRINGPQRIDVMAALSFNSGQMAFIDAGTRVTLVEPAIASAGHQLAFHGVEFDARDNSAYRLQVSSADPDSSLTLHDCVVTGFALSGSKGVRSAQDSRLAILGTTLWRNTATPVVEATGAACVVRDSLFDDNEAVASNSSTLSLGCPARISRCSFTRNRINYQSGLGGGLVWVSNFFRDKAVVLDIDNTTFSTNHLAAASNFAVGAIVANSNGFSVPWRLKVDHCTFTANTMGTGRVANSGAVAGSTFQAGTSAGVTNSIFSENGFQPIRSFVTGGGNLADTPLAGALGTDLVSTDPLLAPLSMGRNGTLHHALLTTSPAIDAALATPAGPTDARGTIRYVDGDNNASIVADIGAVESGRILTVTTSANENNGGLGLGAGDSLLECLLESLNGPVNIAISPSVTQINSSGSSTYLLPLVHTADINAGLRPLRLNHSSSQRLFYAQGTGLTAAYGLTLDSDRNHFWSRGESTLSLARCTLQGVNDTTVSFLSEDASVYLLACEISSNTLAPAGSAAYFTSDRSSLWFDGSTLARNSYSPGSTPRLVAAGSGTRAVFTRATIAENRFGTPLVDAMGRVAFHRCTFHRNGGIPGFNGTGSGGLLSVSDSIFSRNHGVQALSISSDYAYSRGGNLSDLGDALLTESGDLVHFNARLAPLAIYRKSGLPVCPPLAASPVFGTRTGASDPPASVITVTTTANENNTPAGSSVSLREAIRDIAPGGTIRFAPALNDQTFDGGALAVTRDMTIDASDLPSGVDVHARFSLNEPGATLALHALHVNDNVADGGSGGALFVPAGNIVASLCTFSNTNGFTDGGAIAINGNTTLENCTFAQLDAKNTSAVELLSGSHLIRHCTFTENIGTGVVIKIAPLAGAVLYGNLIANNDHPSVSGTPILSDSNIFGDAPAFASGTDMVNVGPVNLLPFGPRGGYAPTGSFPPLTIQDHVTNIGALEIQPPETDARGYHRVAGAALDAGSHEFGGEILYGNGFGDSDGLPAWWELTYGLDPLASDDPDSDADNDGMTLAEEYAALTDPFDPASFFAYTLVLDPATETGGASVTSPAGHRYDLETSITLVPLSWSTIETITGLPTGNSYNFSLDPETDPKRFFRLRRVAP